MSIYYSGVFTRSSGIYSAIGKQLKAVSLKPVKRIVYTFDPFQTNVKTIRNCLFMFSSEKILGTNPRCTIKTDIVDNSEPTIEFTLEEGNKKYLIKTENLDSLQVLQEFNRIVVPLIPKEEELTGKVAGKIAASAAGKKGSGGGGAPRKK